MPAPVPPPPSQPSLEQTRQAVLLIYGAAAAAALIFIATAGAMGPQGALVSWGRASPQAWALARAHSAEIQEAPRLRDHRGGRIAWLIGSSILRQSFDEEWINSMLASRGSAFRVRKFGMTRGAPGVSAGLLDELPLREGDLVVHGLSLANFHKDWLDWVEFPEERLAQLFSRAEMSAWSHWSAQERLELLVSLPWDYWAWRSEAQRGAWAALEDMVEGRSPEPARPGVHWGFRKDPAWDWRADRAMERAADPDYQGRLKPEEIELKPGQFNYDGLLLMEESARAAGAELRLLDLPATTLYQRSFVEPEAQVLWEEWKARSGTVTLLAAADEEFYDLKHPGEAGRLYYSDQLVSWLLSQEYPQAPKDRP